MCIFRDFHLFNVFYQWLAESAPAGRIDAEGKMRNAEYLKHLNSIQILSSNREPVTGQAPGCIMQSCLPFWKNHLLSHKHRTITRRCPVFSGFPCQDLRHRELSLDKVPPDTLHRENRSTFFQMALPHPDTLGSHWMWVLNNLSNFLFIFIKFFPIHCIFIILAPPSTPHISFPSTCPSNIMPPPPPLQNKTKQAISFGLGCVFIASCLLWESNTCCCFCVSYMVPQMSNPAQVV